MTQLALVDAPPEIGALSPVALASVLDQSVDCVKLIGLDGHVQYMNANGLCAMEIDVADDVLGQHWADLWPAGSRDQVRTALPRASAGETVRFRSYCPTAKGSSRWWDVTVSSVVNADGRHAGYLAVSRDVTDNHLSREAMEIATIELIHRLKNTYTMVSSLIHGFARGNSENEAFARDMSDRLRALSVAQCLLGSHDAPCELAVLAPALLLPFDSAICPVTIDMPAGIEVNRGQADAIALVIGELAVNSAKHGALAHGGSLDLKSTVEGQLLTTVWTERSNTPVQARSRDGGQGLKLMERIVGARRGTIETVWQPHGPIVTFAFVLQ